ncbi:MAG: ATP phosphoribosyltransferase [Rhizobiales bacterium 65-9]|nr:ATP phosphoribosyltransferase [Hyphomicrobiales bacterium]OJY34785.1 MAG: ATP phosphoribosyltransferase [Rhizobiales bacterium 65-9]
MNGQPLVLGIPSKGRLQENAAAFFARAGLSFVRPRGALDYRGSVAGVPGAELQFLSASEITQQIAAGAVHIGVTGEDLVRETIPDADSRVVLLSALGFGHANVVVAAPRAWIDVATMADLDEVAHDLHHRHGRRMRVATKYVQLTRRFFATHGISDYQIVESAGATEGAPAAGTAEIIVDITSSGATLSSNGLKVLEDGLILKSEANLVASVNASWSEEARRAARSILARIAAAQEAARTAEVRAAVAAVAQDALDRALADHGAHLPFGPPAAGAPLLAHCPRAQAAALAEALVGAGATHASIGAIDYLFTGAVDLSDRLFGRIDAASA